MKGNVTLKRRKKTSLSKAKGKGKRVDGEVNAMLPTHAVYRTSSATRPPECYATRSNDKYITGLTSQRSNNFEELLEGTSKKFSQGTLKTKAAAEEWLDAQVQDS